MPLPSLSKIACAALLVALGSARAADVPAADVLQAAEATISTLQEQLKSQDQQLRQMRAQADKQQASLVDMQMQLSSANAAAAWLPWLMLALVVASVASLMFGLRLSSMHRRKSRRRSAPPPSSAVTPDLSASDAPAPGSLSLADLQIAVGDGTGDDADGRWQPSSMGPATQMASAPGLAPMVTPSRPSVMDMSASRNMATSPMPRVMHPMADATQAMPGRSDFSLGTGVPPREVSVEELLDLEQQVDFFMVLGQDEAAIDLLVSHIRATGGTSALPYLKLMEIYRHRGNADDYERTRSRFNKRFSAQAPAWGGELAAGRSLEDYPDVLARLQTLWTLPSAALVELEGLMHPQAKGRGFDLPAFRELLLLHGVAGDLRARSEPDRRFAEVDLLLPLGEEPLETTAPQPRLSVQPMAPTLLMPRPPRDLLSDDDEQQLVAESASGPMHLDLDLSDFAPAPREFTRPAAFTDVNMFRDSRRSGFAPLDPEVSADRPK